MTRTRRSATASTIAVAATIATAILCVAAPEATQTRPPAQPEQRPVFRTGTELVAVDVTALDGKGQPVRDLTIDDFVLAVDGRPRRIVSVEYVRPPQTVAASARTNRLSTNIGYTPGRLIVLVIDQGNIRRGGGRATIAAAARFLARLDPSDRVALAVLPHGRRIDFTGDLAQVTDALKTVVGEWSIVPTSFNIGVSEAVAISDDDQWTTDAVIQRECRAGDTNCALSVISEALSLAADVLQQSRTSLTALRAIIDGLARIDGPKTMVLLSEGLTLSRSGISELDWVASATQAARVSIYTLHLDREMFDASESRPSPTAGADARSQLEGLENLAGLARGTVLRVASAGDFAFERISTELAGYYLLTFEPEAPDRDGKAHKIRLDVRRDGLTLRSRREFVVRPVLRRSEPQLLADLLETPFAKTELPIKIATYSLRDPGSQRLRVLVSAEIDVGMVPTPALDLAFAVSGRGRSEPGQRVKVTAPAGRETGPRYWTTGLVLEPGTYTLKVGALDPTGRTGSLEHRFEARLTEAGGLQIADLVLAEEAAEAGQGLRPSLDLDPTVEVIGTYLELYGDRAALGRAAVRMEVAAGDTEPALVMQTARLVDTREPARRTARGVISIGLLPPGSYVARAVVSVDNREIGRAVHPFRIPVRPAAASSAAVSPGEALAVPPVDGFSSDAVLDGALVGPYLDRIESEALDHPSGPLKTALADARAGRFAGLAAMTPASAGEQLAASFLRGMGLLAKGDLENAAGQFRAVLKIRSDFFPALVYLGACYAAGGRDREAAAAWQTSLITESDNAAIYRLLADALLRARDADQAVAVLREAVDAWPEDADIGRRLAMALVAANQRGDALSALTVHLDRNPTDVEGLLLAIQLIYQAHAADRPIADRARERELLARYADAYRAANGPQQALVDKWVKFLDEKR